MKYPATLNETKDIAPDNTDYREHQVTILVDGTPPAGAAVALQRLAAGSTRWLPVSVNGVPVSFAVDNLLNDTVIVLMQIDKLRFVPNAAFTGDATSKYGYKIISRRG